MWLIFTPFFNTYSFDIITVVYHTILLPPPSNHHICTQDIKNLMETGLILPEKCVRLVDILLGAQSLPMSGDAGGEHARKVQKLILEKPPAAGGTTKKKKKKPAKK